MGHSRTDYESGNEHYGPGRNDGEEDAEQTRRRSADASSDEKRPDHQYEAELKAYREGDRLPELP